MLCAWIGKNQTWTSGFAAPQKAARSLWSLRQRNEVPPHSHNALAFFVSPNSSYDVDDHPTTHKVRAAFWGAARPDVEVWFFPIQAQSIIGLFSILQSFLLV